MFNRGLLQYDIVTKLNEEKTSQSNMCETIGISYETLYRFFSGKGISIQTFGKIIGYLNTEPNKYFDYDN